MAHRLHCLTAGILFTNNTLIFLSGDKPYFPWYSFYKNIYFITIYLIKSISSCARFFLYWLDCWLFFVPSPT